MNKIDDPATQDNRNYNYEDASEYYREEYDIIISLIEPNSKIIDLGCGNGVLLEKLIKEKNVKGKGIEISESGVAICRDKNLDVVQMQIDTKLPYENDTFVYSICNVTLQMVNYPEILINEMRRISKYQIISFPNFAFYKNRLDLFFKGRMPTSLLFGYKWFNTGHIHQLSIKDFKDLISNTKYLQITKQEFVKPNNKLKYLLMKLWPNLFQYIPIFVTKKISN